MGQDSPPVFGVLGTQWFRRLQGRHGLVNLPKFYDRVRSFNQAPHHFGAQSLTFREQQQVYFMLIFKQVYYYHLIFYPLKNFMIDQIHLISFRLPIFPLSHFPYFSPPIRPLNYILDYYSTRKKNKSKSYFYFIYFNSFHELIEFYRFYN